MTECDVQCVCGGAGCYPGPPGTGRWKETPMEKPLHVRVAEALGWTVLRTAPLERNSRGTVYLGKPPDRNVNEDCPPSIPWYDTDWAATGPLIEKYRIELLCCEEGRNCSVPEHLGKNWEAAKSTDPDMDANGPTPLVAVCNLILALSAAGKL